MHNVSHTPEARAKISLALAGKPRFGKRRPSVCIDGIELYRCGTCRAFFGRDSFYKTARTIFGIRGECKRCFVQTTIRTRDPEMAKEARVWSSAMARAREAGTGGRVSRAERDALLALWGSKCLKCGATSGLQWDHVQPIARGGRHCITNIQRLCARCNDTKHTAVADYRTEAQRTWAVTFQGVPRG